MNKLVTKILIFVFAIALLLVVNAKAEQNSKRVLVEKAIPQISQEKTSRDVRIDEVKSEIRADYKKTFRARMSVAKEKQKAMVDNMLSYTDYLNNILSKNKIRNISKIGMLGLLNNLKRSINKLKLSRIDTEWGDYYNFTNYSSSSASHKADTVLSMVKQSGAETILDIGSNNGQYSRVATAFGATVISADIDPIAVENNYLTVKDKKESSIIPIIQDMTNPSSSIGWAHNERGSLQDRSGFDLVMALALVHHLAISNNVPFDLIAKYLSKLGKFLIIEFVPKEDSKVVKLLSSREDIFPEYNEEYFIKSFSRFYKIINRIVIKESKRTLCLMQVKNG